MLLNEVLFTNYRRRVLGLLLLNPDKRFHVREIARLTGTVAGTVNRELAKLAAAGLLEREKVGNQLHYSANRNCPVFEELTSILRKTSGIVDVIARALLPWAEQIDLAFVFGSMASGKARAESDVDLLVVGTLEYGELVTALYPLQEELQREINPKLYSPNEWQKLLTDNGSFVRELKDKPKLFIIGSDDDFT